MGVDNSGVLCIGYDEKPECIYDLMEKYDNEVFIYTLAKIIDKKWVVLSTVREPHGGYQYCWGIWYSSPSYDFGEFEVDKIQKFIQKATRYLTLLTGKKPKVFIGN